MRPEIGTKFQNKATGRRYIVTDSGSDEIIQAQNEADPDEVRTFTLMAWLLGTATDELIIEQ